MLYSAPLKYLLKVGGEVLTTTAQTLSGAVNELKTALSSLATVATTGSYNDLVDQPTIPDISTRVAKSGDTMTGALNFNGVANAINFNDGQYPHSMIRFKSASDEWGAGVIIGGGGLTVIGGGESADTYAADVGGSSEMLVLANDGNVNVVTNLQSGKTYGKTFTFDTAGRLTVPQHLTVDVAGGSYISQKDINNAAIKIATEAVVDGSRYDSIIGGKSKDGSFWNIGIINNTIVIGRYTSSYTSNDLQYRIDIPLTMRFSIGDAFKSISRTGKNIVLTRANGGTQSVSLGSYTQISKAFSESVNVGQTLTKTYTIACSASARIPLNATAAVTNTLYACAVVEDFYPSGDNCTVKVKICNLGTTNQTVSGTVWVNMLVP